MSTSEFLAEGAIFPGDKPLDYGYRRPMAPCGLDMPLPETWKASGSSKTPTNEVSQEKPAERTQPDVVNLGAKQTSPQPNTGE